MSLDGGEVVKLCLENLTGKFSCHRYDDVLCIVTPYLYHDNDMIAVYLEELPGGQVKVHDGAEAVMHPFCHGFDLSRSEWGMEAVRQIARNDFLELDRCVLSKTGPVEDVGQLIMDVVMAARGISDLLYAHGAQARITRNRPDTVLPYRLDEKGSSLVDTVESNAFSEKLTTFLAESSLDYTPAAKLSGSSGQVYTVHYRIAGAAYLQALNPGRASRAKAAVDRTFGLWADCNGALTRDRKLTLLNDETLPWKAAHIHRLSQVSTVIKWSEREKLPALLAALS